ncbi:MAG: hypothetical protein HQL53_01835 [Magnetococcales bacterium]|nr:hypothetical protein [Magnetococcales bacterium]
MIPRIDHQQIHAAALKLAMSASSVIHTSAYGIVLVDRSRRICSVNRLAEAMMAQQDGLYADKDQIFCVHVSSEEKELGRLINKISASVTHTALTGAMAISRCSDARPYSVMLHPYALTQNQQVFNLVILAIHDHEIQRVASCQAMQRFFGLTESEAEVLGMMVESGRPIPEIAKFRGVSAHTVKSQMDKIRKKVGATNQMDLLRIVMGTPGVFEIPTFNLKEPVPQKK